MNPVVDIILDGERYAARNWTIIPRVGEIVILKGGEVWAEVTQVVWGDDSAAGQFSNRQWIQLICKTIERPA